ncbi:hypothetical protein [Metabacillus bambusae]|uniref:Uncharacterized protein n=1 Tax=Metabacillus bambusae TaxID=2795218 RepID=A0ABS3NAH5_9BACI|nr:hypothetical protein [Metabacillus bambusae]MBO1515051.1 hypothetical protein [Metabacillus bambusae]
MSLFGYPADIVHNVAILDTWNRITGYNPVAKKAKVVEEQKLIRNAEGEEVHSIAEVHLEGSHSISTNDYFLYTNVLGQEVRYTVRHIEIKKTMGTDDVKKVIIYG